ncbi:MAG: hypothetical protein P8M72_03495 [Gammaproteobacteria bacterium]|nr:hypothetical protein [Gammaproteobacteria bacterium]
MIFERGIEGFSVSGYPDREIAMSFRQILIIIIKMAQGTGGDFVVMAVQWRCLEQLGATNCR